MIRISYKFEPEPIIGKDGKKYIPSGGRRVINVVEPIKICEGVWTVKSESGDIYTIHAEDITGIITGLIPAENMEN